ncbi:MAG: ornithine cyclodeaminase family protein [Candidatus Dormiibacterota bacterium]
MSRGSRVGGASLLMLSGDDVASVLSGLELLDPIAKALMSYSSGAATSPPRAGAPAPQGWLGAMPAYLPERSLAAKLVTVFPGNMASGHPTHQGIVALFDAEDGHPLCILDARHITAVRTAAVTALSVRELARSGARVLTVLGSGEQARSHLQVVPSVRQFSEVRLAARNQERGQVLASEFPDCHLLPSFEQGVRGADVVLCCTNSPEPVVRLSWLSRGVHLASVGMGAELDEYTVRESRLFVEWRGAVSSPPPAGAIELQGLNPEAVTELGELLAGTQPGRLSAEEVTLFKSTGLGVEDAAVARAVYDLALTRRLGVEVAW